MPTITIQPNETAGFDATINQNAPTTNLGSATDFAVGDDNSDATLNRGLIKFDLSSIPSDATINSATLTFTLVFAGNFRASNNRTMRAYRVLRSWVESETTWNVYSSGNSWGTAGCSNTTTDREATDVGTVAMATTDAQFAEKSITLSASSVQEMLSGGSFTNNGWLIKVDTETNDRYFFASSGDTTASYRPKLVIDYTEATTTSTTTSTSTTTTSTSTTTTSTSSSTTTSSSTSTSTTTTSTSTSSSTSMTLTSTSTSSSTTSSTSTSVTDALVFTVESPDSYSFTIDHPGD